ncbi:MAG: TolC family protein [Planctomyces sp.]|nr:TolC family protein [Planctomyces sp.]
MRRVRLWHLSGTVSLSLLCLVGTSGCRSAIQSCTGRYIAKASTPVDYTPTTSRDDASSVVPPAPGSMDSPESPNAQEVAPIHEASLTNTSDRYASNIENDQPVVSSAQPQRFQIPKELPGADAPPLQMPPLDPTLSPEQRKSLAASLFPEIADAEPADVASDEHSLTLATLQQMGIDNSPIIRQAAADVEEARGLAVQAGLKPNPTVGYQGDTIGTADTSGYNGVSISQEIVTAGKLTLAQNTALMEMRAKEAELRKARIELATRIRRGYFRVLVAQEQVKFNSALARLSAEVYKAQIDLVTGGEAAPYEPLQLRVFAVQARNSVIQAQNNLAAEWRQLAANLGMPNLPSHRVEGSVEAVIPAIDYDQAAALLVQKHSDLQAAQSRIAKANCNLRLQQITPIPNVSLYAAFQHDDTSPLSDYSTNLQLSVPVPVFDRNQGNISAAHAQLVRANQNLSETQNSLLGSLADIHARRSSSLVIVNSYRSDLLPDQVRVYRGVYDRFRAEGDGIDFSQVVVAQQTLAQVVTSYLNELQTQWDSTVELAALLQIDDFMTFDGLALPSEQP